MYFIDIMHNFKHFQLMTFEKNVLYLSLRTKLCIIGTCDNVKIAVIVVSQVYDMSTYVFLLSIIFCIHLLYNI